MLDHKKSHLGSSHELPRGTTKQLKMKGNYYDVLIRTEYLKL